MDSLSENPAALLASLARTNVALYKQLHAAGWPAQDLIRLRDAYEFATLLFVGQCRPSGKAFLAHVIGTASILAALGADRETVTAGLLHAAYDHGDFGLTRWRNRRARLRRAIGDAAEALVWRYQELGWGRSMVARMREGVESLTPTDRTILLMRLANELDDNLDLEMRYCHASKDLHREERDSMPVLARMLGQPALANAFEAAYRELENGSWADSLSLDRPDSYLLASPFGLRVLRLTRAVINAVWR